MGDHLRDEKDQRCEDSKRKCGHQIHNYARKLRESIDPRNQVFEKLIKLATAASHPTNLQNSTTIRQEMGKRYKGIEPKNITYRHRRDR
jgi:hypothetical protein